MKAIIAIVCVILVGYAAQGAWAAKSSFTSVQKAVDRIRVAEGNLN